MNESVEQKIKHNKNGLTVKMFWFLGFDSNLNQMFIIFVPKQKI